MLLVCSNPSLKFVKKFLRFSLFRPGYWEDNSWDSPDPRQGPESPFPGKEGFGVQKPPFPLGLEKGVFCQKKSPFFLQGNMGIF